jgi:hypothetical protein
MIKIIFQYIKKKSFFQNSSMNSITQNQKKGKNKKKCRKKLRGQIKFQLNLTQIMNTFSIVLLYYKVFFNLQISVIIILLI